ncbi:MAG: hypothetical protein R3293_17110 [Candidatus Promineifilaceae bacterium]|nr:hypothetical protein [Candidatus Promineifilaceae bacterium]
MLHIMVRHRVADYAKWKTIFDAGSEMRAAASSVKGHIFRDAEDPSMVTILSHFEDADKAKAFLQSPDLAEAMKSAGVTSEPELFVFGHEEKYVD